MLKKKAFTLAEVLIVMALIGFLFTLMIPNIVQKQSSTKYVEKAQQAQRILQDAFRKVAEDNDGKFPMDWESVRESNNKSEAIVKELAKKTSVMSFCGDKLDGCFSTKGYTTINGVSTNILTEKMKRSIRKRDKREYILRERVDKENHDSLRKPLQYEDAKPKESITYFVSLDAGSVALKTNSKYCDGIIMSTDPIERPLCGILLVDVNGPSIPNILGVDVFGFYLSGNDILPMGFFGDDFAFENNCVREKPNAPSDNGLACTAWIINNKNMDYRRCQAGSRLSWTGDKHCELPSK